MKNQKMLNISEEKMEELISEFVEKKFSINDKKWIDISEELLEGTNHFDYWAMIKQTISSIIRGGSLDHRRDGWEKKWAQTARSRPFDRANKKSIYLKWRENSYLINILGQRRIFSYMLSCVINELQPKSILEMGCGDGLQLITLSRDNREIKCFGVDISPSGLISAINSSREPDILQLIDDYSTPIPRSNKGPIDINLYIASGEELPFADNSFDLTYTVATLEQMKAVKRKAVRELVRVTKKNVVLFEPWHDYNLDKNNRNYIRQKRYFDLKIKDLKSLGLKVISENGDLPSKLNYCIGAVVTEVV